MLRSLLEISSLLCFYSPNNVLGLMKLPRDHRSVLNPVSGQAQPHRYPEFCILTALWVTLLMHAGLVGWFWNKENEENSSFKVFFAFASLTRTCVNEEQAISCRAMAGYVVWSGISISGKQNGRWGWAFKYCAKNPSMWRPCSAFKTSSLLLSLVLSVLLTGRRFPHGKNARDWILTEYGISMADSQAHGQSQEKNVELHAKKAVAQGWSSRSAHRTAGTVCPDIVPQGIMNYKCDGRDRQNNSRTSFLRRCIPRKKEKKKNFQKNLHLLFDGKPK